MPKTVFLVLTLTLLTMCWGVDEILKDEEQMSNMEGTGRVLLSGAMLKVLLWGFSSHSS
jgi:hypothetical protein